MIVTCVGPKYCFVSAGTPWGVVSTSIAMLVGEGPASAMGEGRGQVGLGPKMGNSESVVLILRAAEEEGNFC